METKGLECRSYLTVWFSFALKVSSKQPKIFLDISLLLCVAESTCGKVPGAFYEDKWYQNEQR
jgi:hypothetical protein